MANTDKILNKEQAIFDAAESKFIEGVKDSESDIWDEIFRYVAELNVTAGKLSDKRKTEAFLLSLEKKIRDAFKSAGYNQAVIDLVTDFDKIAENKIKLHDAMNGKRILISQIAPVKRIEVQKTLDNLIGAGISRDFIYPIRQELYRQLLVGGTIEQTEKAIKRYVVSRKDSESRLLQYSKQVATDAINQFAGTIEGVISNEFGFNAVRYVGSIIKDSRGQCRHWVDQGKILLSDLDGEIETALDGGKLGVFKCSGMIPGTDVNNFQIYRGGYNCRHRAISTNI